MKNFLSSRAVAIALCCLIMLGFAQQPQIHAADKPKGEIIVWNTEAANGPLKQAGLYDAFAKEYPDIKVTLVKSGPADISQKLLLAISGGSGAPDVALLADTNVPKFIALDPTGKTGLSDLSQRAGNLVSDIVPSRLHVVSKDGKLYAVPWDTGPVVMYYRRDVFKSAGFKDDPDSVSAQIETWDKYLETCKTILDKTGSLCFSLNKANNTARLYEILLLQQGLTYVNDKGEVTIDSPQNIAALETLGKFWSAKVVTDQQEWTDPWYADLSRVAPDDKGKPVATLIEASWMGTFFKTWLAPGTSGKWGVVRMPAWAAGGRRAAESGGSAFVIPAGAKNPEAAWAYVEFMVGRKDNLLRLFAVSDFLPSLKSTYDDAMFIEKDAFFGGQATRQIYVDVLKDSPEVGVANEYYQDINPLVSTAIQKYATGSLSAADALKEAANAARQQLNLK